VSDQGAFAGLRPGALAKVWGTAFGQMIELWRAVWLAALEVGSGEKKIPGGHCIEITVPTTAGRPPRLTARNLVGESFGKTLDSGNVKFRVIGYARPGFVQVDCRVDETKGQPIQGDIYRGDVVDEQGVLITGIALDAGS
jgi:hypothetical protein